MFKCAIAGLALCLASSPLWAGGQASSRSTTVGIPGLGMPVGGYYGPPAMVYPAPMYFPPPVIGVYCPASPYNPRIDSPPFTMMPDFSVFEVKPVPPPVIDKKVPKR